MRRLGAGGTSGRHRAGANACASRRSDCSLGQPPSPLRLQLPNYGGGVALGMKHRHEPMEQWPDHLGPSPSLGEPVNGAPTASQSRIRFGPSSALLPEPYIHMRGGRVNFARLAMSPTDLATVTKGRSSSLGSSPRNSYRQLVAGYTIGRPDYGLAGHVADYRSLLRLSPIFS